MYENLPILLDVSTTEEDSPEVHEKYGCLRKTLQETRGPSR